MKQNNNFDVIIIGGSYAGLSAAMALGRSLRNVLVIDGGQPCNRQTPHSHNFITQDGETPLAIAQRAKEQVLNYSTVTFVNGIAVEGQKTDNGFSITVQSGECYTAQKLIFATGVKDIMPNIAGFASSWGISVVHCPYCHGYEIREQKTGILANGEMAFHLAQLVYNLTKELVILTNGAHTFTPEQLEKLSSNNIPILEQKVAAVEHENGHLSKVIFNDTSALELNALYARIAFEQHCNIPQQLGCELTEQGHLAVSMLQETNVAGIYACGDNATPMRSVAYAVATGNIAGAMTNNALATEAF